MNHTEAEPPVGRSGRPGASPGTDPIGADEVAGDDAAVGRAFRVSLAVIGVLAIVGAAIWWVSTRPAPVKVEPTITPEAPNAPTRTIATIPAIPFTNMRAEAGIAFERENGARGEKLLPETMGGGVAVLDYDNDGDEDLFFVNGMPWRPEDGPAAPSVLYRNDGGWRFTDVTAESGPALVAQGMGTAVGDYDNDGWRDLFVTTLGRNRLFHNDHGHFREVTDEAGVGGEDDAWSTGAAFVDYDNDGDLDLFVANYVKWSRDIDFEVDYQMTGVGRAYGPPTNFQGTQSVLYRNDGDGRFTDVSESAGVLVTNPATGVPVGKGLAVAPVDLDGDGWIDFVVANDTVQNFVFHNQGDGRFREVGVSSSLAFDRNGSATGAMGIDAADYRNANVLGIAVGNFANEMTSFFVAQGAPLQFADDTVVEGIGAPTRLFLSFGLLFLDADLDGRLDLLQANGHIEDEISVVQPSQRYAQPAQLFWNQGDAKGGCFVEVPAEKVGDLANPIVGRGIASADLDGDGDLDVVLTQPKGAPEVLRNDQALGHHWLRVRLEGRTANRDGIGAWIELEVDGAVQRRQVMPTRGYLGQSAIPVTFGLGDATAVDALRVRWPGGSVQSVEVGGVDREIVVVQDAGVVSTDGQ